jgi:hypothetical protein
MLYGRTASNIGAPTDTTLPEVIRVYHDECCYDMLRMKVLYLFGYQEGRTSWIQETSRPDCNVLRFESFPFP